MPKVYKTITILLCVFSLIYILMALVLFPVIFSYSFYVTLCGFMGLAVSGLNGLNIYFASRYFNWFTVAGNVYAIYFYIRVDNITFLPILLQLLLFCALSVITIFFLRFDNSPDTK